MSELTQFLGMRRHHDTHRGQAIDDDYRSWRDCDACLAIAAWDELDVALRDVRDFLRTHGYDIRLVDEALKAREGS